jgi:FG-GAP-like repeat
MIKAAWVPICQVLVATALIAGCSTAPAAVGEAQPTSPVTTTPSDSTALVTTRPADRATPPAFPSPTIAIATKTTLPALTATREPKPLWSDATEQTIGTTAEWTNKVELADIDGDGRVDILFANGGDYETPGKLVMSRAFRNQGPGKPFVDVSEAVFGAEGRLARVIKVCELSGDGQPDIIVGTTFQTQSGSCALLVIRGAHSFV